MALDSYFMFCYACIYVWKFTLKPRYIHPVVYLRSSTRRVNVRGALYRNSVRVHPDDGRSHPGLFCSLLARIVLESLQIFQADKLSH